MEHRRIGSLTVSTVGLGCNNFGMRIDYAATETVVRAALDEGITFFDTADIYGSTQSEEFLGRALGARRKDVVVATKFGIRIDSERGGGARPAYISRAVEDSLRRLSTDWIDLYQLHQPDLATPIEDTLGALADLTRAGKVREIGCSNFSAVQLRDADAAVAPGNVRFMSVQNEYSLLHRAPEQEVLPACERLGLAFIPYFPLASGLLTGKYHRGSAPPVGTRLSEASWAAGRFLTDQRVAMADALAEFARSRGHSLLELAMSWLIHRPAVASAIAGATTAEQVRANVRAGTAWGLTVQDLGEIDRITQITETPVVDS